MLPRLFRALPLLLTLTTAVVGCLIALAGWRESKMRQTYEKANAHVEVTAPSELPSQDQESIDIALTLFSIAVPETVDGPYYDPMLSDRGLTTGGLLLPHKRVTIGPSAFTSWAVLGSTLAHELEVHVPQSFFWVVAEDHFVRWRTEAKRFVGRIVPSLAPSAKELFENDGTWKAERDAYMHEIKNAKRFGMTEEELSSIWRVMDYFYPTRQNDTQDPQLSASSESPKETPEQREINSSEL